MDESRGRKEWCKERGTTGRKESASEGSDTMAKAARSAATSLAMHQELENSMKSMMYTFEHDM